MSDYLSSADSGIGLTVQYTSDDEKYPYLVYDVYVTYSYDSGLRQLPVSDTGEAPADVVRLHAPISRKVVTFKARRLGAKPDAPDPTSTDPNEVLESAVVTPAVPLPGDGTWTWEIAGRYEYFLLRPLGPKTTYVVPKVPYATASATQLNFPGVNFRQDLS